VTLVNLQFINHVIITKTKVLLSKTYVTLVNLQFINHVIITKTKVLLPKTYVTLANFGDPVKCQKYFAINV
jgi:hypothetical protein